MRESWTLAALCHLDLNLLFLLHSEIAKYEEILIDYKRYKDLLFKLSPPEWQEAQTVKVLSNKETQDWQKKKPEESAIRNGKLFVIINIMVSNEVSSSKNISGLILIIACVQVWRLSCPPSEKAGRHQPTATQCEDLHTRSFTPHLLL